MLDRRKQALKRAPVAIAGARRHPSKEKWRQTVKTIKTVKTVRKPTVMSDVAPPQPHAAPPPPRAAGSAATTHVAAAGGGCSVPRFVFFEICV